MNVLLVSIDSLRRDFLGAYRHRPTVLEYDVATPNLDRFAERATVFDTHYAGSLPCMPARREWHAGIQEFLWRPWGPIEPFDTTLPAAAREAGTVTKLVTDHFHYFQHGSHGYYEDYNGFEFVRGHEFDAWKTAPRTPDPELLAQTTIYGDDPNDLDFLNRVQYARNVNGIDDGDETDFFASRVFSRAAEWVSANQEWDQWFCYVDSFDVHEPFHCPEPYASTYTDEDPRDPDLHVWPPYGPIDEGVSELSDRTLEFVRSQFAGKVTMVDEHVGRLFNRLDEEELWDETVVIVTSDHGYMLGEHGWIAKNFPPLYDTLARTPLLIWHPEFPGGRVDALTSAVDLYATILETLDANVPEHVHSKSLLPLLDGETDDHREWALYGQWGASVNVTDGRYTYHHPCDDTQPTNCYSTSMMNARGPFVPTEPKHDAVAGQFLPYTDSPVWKFAGPSLAQLDVALLFDTLEDPTQERNLAEANTSQTERMQTLLKDAMKKMDAPDEQYDRLCLEVI